MSIYGMGLKSSPSKKQKLTYDSIVTEVPKPEVIKIDTDREPSQTKKLEPPKLIKRQLSLNVKYPIEKLIFDDSCVSFLYKINSLDQTIEVIIENDFIESVHDSIKPYFSNVLNTKHINVTIKIEYNETVGSKKSIIKVESSSKEIERITPELIDEVKLKYLKSKNRDINSNENSLLTWEEFLQLATDDENIKDLYGSDTSLFEALIKVTETKHHYHLSFLSEIHDHSTMRLRFIDKPVSFMFLVEREENYYFIWETSDTKEATYLWSFPVMEIENKKIDLIKKLNKIDSIITEILKEGKNHYIKKNEENFLRVYHTYTENLDGFNKWKKDILNAFI